MARGQSFDRAPASDVLSSVDDASSTLRVYADGSAVLQYKEQHKGFWGELAARTWGLFITYYFLWFFAPIILVYTFWGPTTRAVALALSLVYAPTFLDGSEKQMGRPWERLRLSKVWTLSHRYFPTTLIREAPLDPKRQYIFGFGPHGILVMSRIFLYGGAWERLFPNLCVRVLAATPMFFIPLCRDLCLWLSAVDAGRATAERCLAKGLSLVVYPGGSREIFTTDPNSTVTTLVLKQRKGFIKLALRSGAALVPVFVFAEKWCYRLVNPPERVRELFLRWLRVPVLLFWGRWFSWVPLQVPILAVFGAPIEVSRIAEPTEAQVDDLHATYIAAVQDLFLRYKAQAGYSPEESLLIV